MSAAKQLPKSQPAPDQSAVLLVEDEPMLARAYGRVLTNAGQRVVLVNDGREALRAIDEQHFDAVVSDIEMPEMNGMELLSALRGRGDETPLVFMTGAPTVKAVTTALDQGVTAFLLKPVPHEQLLGAVEDALEKARAAQAAHAALEEMDRVGQHLDSALDKLVIAYQPLVRWSDKSTLGYESLVRSAEPALPHPGALFGAADKVGRTEELNRAIRAVAPLPYLLGRDELLFFNLHVLDLQDETVFDPASPLASVAERVVLEITERASVEVVKDFRARVARLRDLGFRIAVDDLGAGYAGLSSMALLDPDVVKLDMTLVRDIETSQTSQRVVSSIRRVCEDMGKLVVAEGVETKEELMCLVDLGCDIFQGYYFARPAHDFPEPQFG